MPSKRLLNTTLKIALCLIGMLVMGYFLYPEVTAGKVDDKLTIIRALVFVGFAYLFIRSVRDMIGHSDN